MITVVGLGFNEGSVSRRGFEAISNAEMVITRTLKTAPSKAIQGLINGSFDYLYDKAADFDALNSTICDELIRLSDGRNLVYCVDGDGYKDSSVTELLGRIPDLKIIPGPFDLALKPSTSCLYLSAYDINGVYPDTCTPICIYAIDDRIMAGEVKLFLLRFYAPETEVLIATGGSCKTIPLVELDRQNKYHSDTAVYAESGNNSGFSDLLRIMARLTAPDGCPWDKAQTHESIRINLIEEAYEAVEAITEGNLPGMIEELGDVMLQAVFHCDIATRTGEFTLEDVVKGLNDKLIGRHTHIFGADKAEGAEGALSVWERNKMKEKHQNTFADSVNDIPKCFPALLRAQKAAKRVSKGGWGQEISVVRDKLLRSLDAFIKADEAGDKQEAHDKLGSALLYLAWLAYLAGADSEQALLDKVLKVQRLYTSYEKAVLEAGRDVNNISKEQRQAFYDLIKEDR